MNEPILPKNWYGRSGLLSLNDEEGTVQPFARLIESNQTGFLVYVDSRPESQRFYSWAGVAWIEVV